MIAVDSALDKAYAAAVGISDDLTLKLREATQIAKWPDNITVSLTVTFQDDAFVIHVPDALKAQVDDLEYGTPTTPPKSVLRKFAAVNMEDGQTNFMSILMDSMVDGGVIL